MWLITSTFESLAYSSFYFLLLKKSSFRTKYDSLCSASGRVWHNKSQRGHLSYPTHSHTTAATRAVPANQRSLQHNASRCVRLPPGGRVNIMQARCADLCLILLRRKRTPFCESPVLFTRVCVCVCGQEHDSLASCLRKHTDKRYIHVDAVALKVMIIYISLLLRCIY